MQGPCHNRQGKLYSFYYIFDKYFLGNGPSGIALSYFLSGHWPYYKGESKDEFLHTRLMVEPHLSLVEQDLQFLSDVSCDCDFYPTN